MKITQVPVPSPIDVRTDFEWDISRDTLNASCQVARVDELMQDAVRHAIDKLAQTAYSMMWVEMERVITMWLANPTNVHRILESVIHAYIEQVVADVHKESQ